MIGARLWRSLRYRGLRRTARLAARWAAFHLRHGRRAAPPGFDLEFGMATDLGDDVPGERAAAPGVEYGPVDLLHFAALLRQVDIAAGGFVFCDFGCGRGRALMLASEYPFHAIRGVEYDRDLYASAERHLARWAALRRPEQRCTDIGVEWGDAVTWAFPVAPSVFYFNEPLYPLDLQSLATRIRASLATAPRPAYVIYLGDWGQPVWEAAGDFERLYQDDDRFVYRWKGH